MCGGGNDGMFGGTPPGPGGIPFGGGNGGIPFGGMGATRKLVQRSACSLYVNLRPPRPMNGGIPLIGGIPRSC